MTNISKERRAFSNWVSTQATAMTACSRALMLRIVSVILLAIASVCITEAAEYQTLSDGTKIRWAAYAADHLPAIKTVVLLQGRASFLEKHNEIIRDLNRHGFTVYAFDWPGQGGSDRFVNHPQMVTVHGGE